MAPCLFLSFIGSEVLQRITADEPGQGSSYEGKYPFDNCDHAALLIAAHAALGWRVDERLVVIY